MSISGKRRSFTITKEFVFFIISFAILISILIYSPNQLHILGQKLLVIGEQLLKLGEQNNVNTEKIINNSDVRFNISGERFDQQFTLLSDFINASDSERQTSGLDIIKVLLLYMQDSERDVNKIMDKLNITNEHFTKVNGTHVITENGTFKLPYPINLTVG